MTTENFNKYQTGVQLCSAQMISDDSQKPKACQMERLNRLYKRTEGQLSEQIIAGLTAASAMKILKAIR